MAAGRYLILDNIRSAHNVGAMFRSADGAGVDRVYVGGYTPTPVDRFGRQQPAIAKTSLGAAATVPWEHCADLSILVQTLQARGVTIAVVEQTPTAVSYQTWQPLGDVAFVFGNEVVGVQPAITAAADVVLELPMRGTKESLNVSTAAGIILYHFLQ